MGIELNKQIVFVDTNVIAYSHDVDSVFHEIADGIIRKCIDGFYNTYISTQVLSELYSTLTKKSYPNPLASADAWLQVQNYYKSECFKVLPINSDVYRVLIRIGRRYSGVRAQNVYDMQIVATMLYYGIDTIITANEKDFRMFEPEGIKVINPFE